MTVEKLIEFTIATAALFLAGWFAVCFIAWEFSIPLQSKQSRTWLVMAAFIVAVAMTKNDEEKP